MRTATFPKLYRGFMQALPPAGTRIHTRDDRRPRDTGNRLTFNIGFNLMIERRFSVPRIRRRCLFVTGDLAAAARYAAALTPEFVGVVQPAGPFGFLYAPNVSDSAAIAEDLGDRYLNCFLGWQQPLCRPLLEDLDLTLEGFERFLADHPEIDHGGFSWSSQTLRQRVLAMLDGCFESRHQRTYRYRNDDLEAAARGHAEVMLHDCQEGFHVMRVTEEELAVALRERTRVPGPNK